MKIPSPDEHPTTETLERFRRSELSAPEVRGVVRHLLSGCRQCRAITSTWWPRDHAGPQDAEEGSAATLAYEGAFDRAAARLHEQEATLLVEAEEARKAWPLLAATAPQERRDRVEAEPRFRSWRLTERVLHAGWEAGFSEPATALELAHLGVAMADLLDAESYGAARVSDLRGRARVFLANALRINSLFRDADRVFAEAAKVLASGTGDIMERARLLLFEATLRGDQRRFAEADHLFDLSASIYRRAGESHLLGRVLLTKGLFRGYAGDSQAAIEILRRGLDLIDADSEPRLQLVAHHNLILHLTETGQPQEARELLEASRPLYQAAGGRMDLVRLRWLEGKVSLALEQSSEAEEIFRDVRQQFADRGLGCDAALVSLDLAGLYAEQGRTDQMRRLASEMLPIFRSRDIHREAMAALIVFQRAAELDEVTVRLVRQIGQFIERSRNNLELRFEPRP